MISPKGPAFLAGPRSVAGRRLQRQLREDELGEAIAFLEMRIAGQDEAIDAERHILLHALGDLVRIADQRRAGAAAHQSDAGPEVRADLELVAPPAMQARHALLADRVEARKGLLGRRDGLVVELAR